MSINPLSQDMGAIPMRFMSYLSESALKVLRLFKDKPEIKLQSNEICKKTGLPDRTVKNAISPLYKNNLFNAMISGQRPDIRLFFSVPLLIVKQYPQNHLRPS